MWGLEQLPAGNSSLLRIYIDHSGGIMLKDCEKVSRQVAALLDVEDPIAGEYRLEVSSPGLERPLFNLEQFSRFQGRQVKIHLRQKHMDRKRIAGVILAVNDEDENIIIETEDFEYTVPAGLIEKANLLYEPANDAR